ncbi:MAG: nickel pincer cofactor biosynthesis protein LarC [Methanomassiliicoccales archaeon]
MSSAIYIDAFSGAAGDMLLSAFVDLGLNVNWLDQQLHQLPVGEFDLTFRDITDRGLAGKQLHLSAPTQTQYRHLEHIRDIILSAAYSKFVTENSIRAFTLLAEAESRVHGCLPENVHFHEVGALDTLIDICGYFLALEKLGNPQVYCSPLPMPTGSLTIAHGEYPLPAPAITFLLQGYHICGTSATQELVTPTAATLLATSAQSLLQWPSLRILGTGYGAGIPGRGPKPNLVRLIWGEKAANSEEVSVIETQMDDISPEVLAYTVELLLKHGALDYFITPIYMKKSRPGFLLTVLCQLDHQETLIDLIFNHTSTLGVRFRTSNRHTIPRRSCQIETMYGLVTLKVASPPSATPRVAPEYEDCARLAREHQVPLHDIYTAALLAWHQQNP